MSEVEKLSRCTECHSHLRLYHFPNYDDLTVIENAACPECGYVKPPQSHTLN